MFEHPDFLFVTFPLVAFRGPVSLERETEMENFRLFLLQVLFYLVINKSGFRLISEHTYANRELCCALRGSA